MKIAFLALKGMPLGGGIEKYTEELGSRLASRGHEVIVYAMRHYGATDGMYRGMRIKTVPAIRTRGLEKLSASLAATLIGCFEEGVDITHFHAFGPSMFSFLPRVLGRKVVVQGHGLEWKRSRWRAGGRLFLKLAELPSVRFPHVVTVVSNVQKKYLMDEYRMDSVCIPTGVNPPVPEPPELIKAYGLSGNDYILFAARLVREKGAHHLIKAYMRLQPSLKLVIAGDARYEKGYKAELYRLAGKDKGVIFTGMATGKLLRELFSNCYLFVQPSETEGLPTGLLEAMSYGNCCLASDIPENIEAMNGLGHIFRCGDADDLARKLSSLMESPGDREGHKERAKAYVLENFSWDKIAARFEELYWGLSCA